MIRLFLVAATLLGLAACATPPAEDENSGNEQARVENEANLRCTYERKTGSSRREKVCRTKEEIEQDQAHAERMLRELDDSSIASGSE